MKKILYTVMALMCFVCCDKTSPTPDPGPGPSPQPEETLAAAIIGEWHYTDASLGADIYLGLTENKKFELYQKIGDGAYHLYKGSWQIDEESAVLSGKYNDSQAWGSEYDVAISGDGKTLTLSPKASGAEEKHTYKREEIPASVRENCVTVVKSEDYSPVF